MQGAQPPLPRMEAALLATARIRACERPYTALWPGMNKRWRPSTTAPPSPPPPGHQPRLHCCKQTAIGQREGRMWRHGAIPTGLQHACGLLHSGGKSKCSCWSSSHGLTPDGPPPLHRSLITTPAAAARGGPSPLPIKSLSACTQNMHTAALAESSAAGQRPNSSTANRSASG